MKFRKLRIAFSAMCLTACVLLIVLWVRSYAHDYVHLYTVGASRLLLCATTSGQLKIVIFDFQPTPLARINFSIPYQWSVAVTAAIVSIPWIRFRFSVRT